MQGSRRVRIVLPVNVACTEVAERFGDARCREEEGVGTRSARDRERRARGPHRGRRRARRPPRLRSPPHGRRVPPRGRISTTSTGRSPCAKRRARRRSRRRRRERAPSSSTRRAARAATRRATPAWRAPCSTPSTSPTSASRRRASRDGKTPTARFHATLHGVLTLHGGEHASRCSSTAASSTTC